MQGLADIADEMNTACSAPLPRGAAGAATHGNLEPQRARSTNTVETTYVHRRVNPRPA